MGVIVVFVVGGKNIFLCVFDMYMEKLVVDSEVKGMIDLNLLFE